LIIDFGVDPSLFTTVFIVLGLRLSTVLVRDKLWLEHFLDEAACELRVVLIEFDLFLALVDLTFQAVVKRNIVFKVRLSTNR
jgi:hypothetical protein